MNHNNNNNAGYDHNFMLQQQIDIKHILCYKFNATNPLSRDNTAKKKNANTKIQRAKVHALVH